MGHAESGASGGVSAEHQWQQNLQQEFPGLPRVHAQRLWCVANSGTKMYFLHLTHLSPQSVCVHNYLHNKFSVFSKLFAIRQKPWAQVSICFSSRWGNGKAMYHIYFIFKLAFLTAGQCLQFLVIIFFVTLNYLLLLKMHFLYLHLNNIELMKNNSTYIHLDFLFTLH